jgi:hypothetical protein
MSKKDSNFEDLEKQLAKDALEKTLKDLHGEITKDIEKNKATFSKEIQKTLTDFKGDLEKTISKELDQRISAHLQKNFLGISTKVTSSFYESSSPLLKRAEEDLQRLHRQGEETLSSWKAMMLQYTNLWTKPFMIAFFASAFAGMVIFFVCASFLWIKYNQEAQNYEKRLASNENMLLWYFEKYKERPEAKKKGGQGSISGPKTQTLSKRSK